MIKISPRRISKRVFPFYRTIWSSSPSESNAGRFKNAGMTLVEVLIVVSLLAGLAALLAPRLAGSNYFLKKTVRQFAGMPQQAHEAAILSKNYYRLVLDMPENRTHSYWVESSSQPYLMETEEQKEERESRIGGDNEPRDKGFTRDEKLTPKPVEFPENLRFRRLQSHHSEEPIEAGTAHIYFMPQGLAQEVVIHLETEEGLKWTVAIHPLTGVGHLTSSFVDLEDLRK